MTVICFGFISTFRKNLIAFIVSLYKLILLMIFNKVVCTHYIAIAIKLTLIGCRSINKSSNRVRL